jgi:hypothetical protein
MALQRRGIEAVLFERTTHPRERGRRAPGYQPVAGTRRLLPSGRVLLGRLRVQPRAAGGLGQQETREGDPAGSLGLKCLAVRLVAEKATPEQIERLGGLLDRAQQRIGDGEKQYPLDLDFHDVLLLIAGNALLTNMLSRIGASVRAIRT